MVKKRKRADAELEEYFAGPPDYSRLRWRVKLILDEQYGGTKTRMAKDLGADPSGSTIGNWIRRDQGMDPHYAYILAEKYRWNPEWILRGVGAERLPNPPTPRDEAVLERYRNGTPEQRSAVELILGIRPST